MYSTVHTPECTLYCTIIPYVYGTPTDPDVLTLVAWVRRVGFVHTVCTYCVLSLLVSWNQSVSAKPHGIFGRDVLYQYYMYSIVLGNLARTAING